MNSILKHGEIYFAGETSKYCLIVGDKAAPFPTESDPSPFAQLNTQDVRQIMAKWKLSAGPKLLLSLIGGARAFAGNAAVLSELCEKIVDLAQEKGAWIVTGGTDCGVMSAIGKKATERNIITIGITVSGAVKGATLIEAEYEKEDKIDYNKIPDDPNITNLEPNHTHFFLVKGNKYGDEIRSRVKIEKEICPLCVTIMIEGGGLTVKEADAAIKFNWPLIVISSTGRGADDVASVMNYYYDKLASNIKASHAAKGKQMPLIPSKTGKEADDVSIVLNYYFLS